MRDLPLRGLLFSSVDWCCGCYRLGSLTSRKHSIRSLFDRLAQQKLSSILSLPLCSPETRKPLGKSGIFNVFYKWWLWNGGSESQDFEGERELKEILPGHSVKEKNLNCICDHPYKEPRYHSDVISIYKGLFIQPLTHKTNARAKIWLGKTTHVLGVVWPLVVNDYHCICTLEWSRRQIYMSYDFLYVTFEIVHSYQGRTRVF